MNKGLASNHENPQKGPATAMPEADHITLRDIPLIAELEAMCAAGKGWSAEFDRRAAEVSVALFGVSADDTNLPYPQDADYLDPRGHLDHRAYEGAVEEYDKAVWAFTPIDLGTHNDVEIIDWWDDEGIDITDDDGVPLRCLHKVQRQLLAAVYEAIPGAALTLDGSGTKAAQNAQAWGAALANQAAAFRAGRKGK